MNLKNFRVITSASILLSPGIVPIHSSADTLELNPVKDNTLYHPISGFSVLSNGMGESLFIGNSNGNPRRAVLRFDLDSQIPAQATIDSVSLSLSIIETSADPQTTTVHRLTADWGEEMSDADENTGGGVNGANPQTDDATWFHRFFSDQDWDQEGGDFESTESATGTAGATGETVTFEGEDLVSDVEMWLNIPSSNFGWLIRGNELASNSVKRVGSRENSNESNRPLLTINFTPAGGGMMQNQTITFNQIPNTTFGLERVTLSATASSGLAVSYGVTSGPGLLNPDNSLSLTGPGTITIRASQVGNASFNAAPDVDQSFSVTQPSSGGASLLTAGDAKYVNDGTEFMGNTYNGFELGGSTGTFSSIGGQITRVSFLDAGGDLMFAEFGAEDPNIVLVITLDPFDGAKVPSPYNQPGTVYAQGHPRFEILNSSSLTFVSFFSLGNDPTRVDNALILAGTQADPVNGIAEIQSLSITDGATQIGGVNAANANFTGTDGLVGIDAPVVVVGVFLFVGDITPSGTAMPVLRVSADSMLEDLFITGGDLAEATGMFEIDTNGVVYPFTITATDGQRSISNEGGRVSFRPDLGDGSLYPVADTFTVNIDNFFVTDGQMARVNQP